MLARFLERLLEAARAGGQQEPDRQVERTHDAPARLLDANPADYARWREEIRAQSRSEYNGSTVLDDLMGKQTAAAVAEAGETPPADCSASVFTQS